MGDDTGVARRTGSTEATGDRAALVDLLHDGPLQLMIAVQQDVEDHLRGEAVDLEATAAALRTAVASIRELGVRQYDRVLRADRLEDEIRAIATARRARGLAIDVDVGADVAGRADTLVALAVRELLSNVVKHSRATTAVVTVAPSPAGVVVRVEDDGVGASARTRSAAASEGHLGLRALGRRVVRAGGVLEFPAVAHGFAAEVRLPTATGAA